MTAPGNASRLTDFCNPSEPGFNTEEESDAESNSELPPVRVWFEGAYTDQGQGGYGVVIKADEIDIRDGDDLSHVERDLVDKHELYIARWEGLVNAAERVDSAFDSPDVVFLGVSPNMIMDAQGRPTDWLLFEEYRRELMDIRYRRDWSHSELRPIDFNDFDDLPPEYEMAQKIAYAYARGDPSQIRFVDEI